MFRPCIDLRHGKVVQIVGASLAEDGSATVNYESDQPSAWYAARYRDDALTGGHIVMLGEGNEDAARAALEVWPGGMQIGGGINPGNAAGWLEAGASHVVVTSWLFVDGELCPDRLEALVSEVGRERIVIDLSCRRRDGAHWVVSERWQRFTSFRLTADVLGNLAESCAEFLVHGVDVEGLGQGIDVELVELLSECATIPVTYAGGARSIADLHTVHDISGGRVDLTIGSALDIFGGSGIRYADCVEFNRSHGR